MLTLPEPIDAFYLEHRRCGDLDGEVKEDRGWMACESCGVQFARAILDEASPLEA